MIKITVFEKPLSVNTAWKGRRFKTEEYQDYEDSLMYTIKKRHPKIEGELSISYVFYLKNYGKTDVGNLEKCITDILVKMEIIKDDRYIREIYLRKERAEKDRIEIEICPYNKK